MDWYAPIAKHFVHPLWALKDGEKHIALWKELERSQYFSPQELNDLQIGRLRVMLEHAYNNSPFYRKRFDDAGVSVKKLREVSDIRKIPLLTKEDIQDHADELVAQNIPQSALMPDKTGGSTGKPLRYYRNRERMDHLRAAAMRHDNWAGYQVGDKQAVIWGNRHDFSRAEELKSQIRNRLLGRKLILDSSSITEEGMLHFAHDLRKFKPKAMLAYANSCALFASFLLEHKIHDIKIDSVITSAEVLHEGEKETIEKAFGCKVFNRYGCREVGVISSECEAHLGLHINAEHLLVEFLRDGRPASPGEEGDIVITDFLNFGMPFIRYRIEDVGTPTDRQCSCGRGLPLMENIAGRITDFLLAPDGRHVSGASLTIYLIANTPGVKQAQIIQDSLDSLRLRIVRGHDFTDDSIAFLRTKVPEFFGHDIKVECEFVDSIPKESSGKYRFSICRVDMTNS